MIKLKNLINEFWMPGSLSLDRNPSPLSYAHAPDDELRSYTESSISQNNPEWFMYNGTNDWQNKKAYCSAYINENGKPIRMWIEVKTKWLRKPNDSHGGHHDRVNKTIKKISRSWASEAKKLHKEVNLSEIGNKTMRTWKECFEQALKSPKVAPYIQENGTDAAAVMDPVNFTPRK